MKKVSELTRPVLPTTTKEGNDRVIINVSLSNQLNFSETSRGIVTRMNLNTPDNENTIRGVDNGRTDFKRIISGGR